MVIARCFLYFVYFVFLYFYPPIFFLRLLGLYFSPPSYRPGVIDGEDPIEGAEGSLLREAGPP